MEKIQTIDEYIATEMGGKIVRKKKSPVGALLLLAVGAGMLILMRTANMGDSLQAASLTAGLICLAVGLILTAMHLSGALWRYCYATTGCRMVDKKVYLSTDDYHRAVEALSDGNKTSLSNLKSVVSSNGAVRVLRSKDGALALVQAGRFDTGHFEAETPVMTLVGMEAAPIESLCRQN